MDLLNILVFLYLLLKKIAKCQKKTILWIDNVGELTNQGIYYNRMPSI